MFWEMQLHILKLIYQTWAKKFETDVRNDTEFQFFVWFYEII